MTPQPRPGGHTPNPGSNSHNHNTRKRRKAPTKQGFSISIQPTLRTLKLAPRKRLVRQRAASLWILPREADYHFGETRQTYPRASLLSLPVELRQDILGMSYDSQPSATTDLELLKKKVRHVENTCEVEYYHKQGSKSRPPAVSGVQSLQRGYGLREEAVAASHRERSATNDQCQCARSAQPQHADECLATCPDTTRLNYSGRGPASKGKAW